MPRRTRRAASKPRKVRDIVVFWILRDSSCDECGERLGKGRFLRREGDLGLCLPCADLDHLVFLPSGNAELTRRARKHSRISPVVVRFSRARKRYERKGVLVDEGALARAKQECLQDHEARMQARLRAAVRLEDWNEQFIAKFVQHIGNLYPQCPLSTHTLIAEHACVRNSGRIGRTAAAKRFHQEAIELAVQAHVRHVATDYDELLARGMDRTDARGAVRANVDEVLDSWSRETTEGLS